MSKPFTNDETGPIFFYKPEEGFGYLGQWYPSKFTAKTESGEERNYINCEQ